MFYRLDYVLYEWAGGGICMWKSTMERSTGVEL